MARKEETVNRVEEDNKASINTSRGGSWFHSTHQLIIEYEHIQVGNVKRVTASVIRAEYYDINRYYRAINVLETPVLCCFSAEKHIHNERFCCESPYQTSTDSYFNSVQHLSQVAKTVWPEERTQFWYSFKNWPVSRC